MMREVDATESLDDEEEVYLWSSGCDGRVGLDGTDVWATLGSETSVEKRSAAGPLAPVISKPSSESSESSKSSEPWAMDRDRRG